LRFDIAHAEIFQIARFDRRLQEEATSNMAGILVNPASYTGDQRDGFIAIGLSH
jgi:hypothetical protein